MKYIYNRLVKEDSKEFNHMGIVYTLSSTNHMGNIDYYTFFRESMEPLLVTPTFALEFKDVIKMYYKIKDVHSHKAVLIRLKAMFDTKPQVEGYTDEDGEKYVYTVKYRDIEVNFSLEDKKFKLQPGFKILSKKVLDSRRVVNVDSSVDFEDFIQELRSNV